MERTWADIGALVKERRLASRLSQRNAAIRAGISPTTWSSVESGQHPMSEMTKAGVARALRWPPNAIDRLAAGDDPAAIPAESDTPPASPPGETELGRRVRDALRAEIADLLAPLSFAQLREVAAFVWWVKAGAATVPAAPALGDYLERARAADLAEFPALAAASLGVAPDVPLAAAGDPGGARAASRERSRPAPPTAD